MIAIDGPAGSGKTTVAVRLADRLGAVYIDTGQLYRAATILALREGIPLSEAETVAARVASGAIEIAPPTVADGRNCDVLLDGADITTHLRTPEVDRNVSAWSAVPSIRAAMLPIQRAFARHQRVVMVGRDIASVIFPDAVVKVYLDASLPERARRRHRDLAVTNPDLTVANVEADLQRRDAIDSSRDAAPLEVADGAIVVQTDGKSIEAVVDEVAALADRHWRAV